MEINLEKCDVMIIGDAAVEDELTYLRQKIPITEKYTYLGIELNNQKDYKMMTLRSAARGHQPLDEVKGMLMNKRIPLQAKKMIIAQVLIPRMTYGMQIFGVNQRNVAGAQSILTTAFNLAIGKAKHARAECLKNSAL